MAAVNLANGRKGVKDEKRFNSFWRVQGTGCLGNLLKAVH